jgi:hypothetical protein|tara:strand:- start:1875 stop:2105 length:231 start_codon:yes stop_codon:yes gene_type:complete
MFHPLEEDLSNLKDQEVEQKLLELTKKYHTVARLGNQDLLTQLSTFVIIYREEMSKRHTRRLKDTDSDMGQLINVD